MLRTAIGEGSSRVATVRRGGVQVKADRLCNHEEPDAEVMEQPAWERSFGFAVVRGSATICREIRYHLLAKELNF